MWDSLGVLGLRAGSAVLRRGMRLRPEAVVVRRIDRQPPDVAWDEPSTPLRVPLGLERPPLGLSIVRLAVIVAAAAVLLSAVVLAVGLVVARALEGLAG